MRVDVEMSGVILIHVASRLDTVGVALLRVALLCVPISDSSRDLK